MEYIEGAPIQGPLPLDEALKIAALIADALDAAHRKGIAHRHLMGTPFQARSSAC
jgi:serine/threonine protein kinase